MKPICPMCGPSGRGELMIADSGAIGNLYRCSKCHRMFDSEPDEGGTHHDRDPSRRIENQDNHRAKLGSRRGTR